ncbi:hypothetical protein [Flagellimonas meishanensis]|uniref:hypothetical protein n=1 Tax=Flagellimonas meishanensis TaxID=2873264 RepID=UPI001CA77FE8|nr:hypothetical protein [[Muricauda] meishanensis]
MRFRIISYLRFLIKSTNAHGVHSPFVFNFVTQCLYSKRRYSNNRVINILLNSIDYFKARSVYLENHEMAKKEIESRFPGIDFDAALCDILLINRLDQSGFCQLLHEGILHNDSMILVDSIHKNTAKLDEWKTLVALPEITVSVDMYFCGAIFIRKEQVKQHFTIRI